MTDRAQLLELTDLSKVDVLPDSRLKHSRAAVYGCPPGHSTAMAWKPVFCANCGKPHGYVPEQNCNFACWLCDPCAELWGEQYGLALMPDELFWAQVHAEMLESHGRILSPDEANDIQGAGLTPLATLLRKGA